MVATARIKIEKLRKPVQKADFLSFNASFLKTDNTGVWRGSSCVEPPVQVFFSSAVLSKSEGEKRLCKEKN
jgi:hypothetical protein